MSARSDEFVMLHDSPLRGPCVYRLIMRGAVVYVGSSVSIEARIANHRSTKFGLWDHALISPCGHITGDLLDRIHEVEAALIWHHQPDLNRDQFGFMCYPSNSLTRWCASGIIDKHFPDEGPRDTLAGRVTRVMAADGGQRSIDISRGAKKPGHWSDGRWDDLLSATRLEGLPVAS